MQLSRSARPNHACSEERGAGVAVSAAALAGVWESSKKGSDPGLQTLCADR